MVCNTSWICHFRPQKTSRIRRGEFGILLRKYGSFFIQSQQFSLWNDFREDEPAPTGELQPPDQENTTFSQQNPKSSWNSTLFLGSKVANSCTYCAPCMARIGTWNDHKIWKTSCFHVPKINIRCHPGVLVTRKTEYLEEFFQCVQFLLYLLCVKSVSKVYQKGGKRNCLQCGKCD